MPYTRSIAVKVEGNTKFREINLGRMMHSLVQWCTLNNLNDFRSKFILKILHQQVPPKPIYQKAAEQSLE
jgi:hypothetical protein